MKKVVIADDHIIFRDALKQILNSSGSYAVVGAAGDFVELRSLLSQVTAPDALIMDLSMPCGCGLEVLKEINVNYPDLAVLILSFHLEEELGVRAFKCGASGFLTKTCGVREVMQALGAVTEGRQYFSRATNQWIHEEVSRGAYSLEQTLQGVLSDRELHVLTMLGKGKTVTQISKDLSLSVKTVSTYRSRVLKKLNLTTNAELIAYLNLGSDA